MSFSKKVFLKKCFIDISTCKKQFFSPLVLFMAKNAIVKQAEFLISEGFPYYSRHSVWATPRFLNARYILKIRGCFFFAEIYISKIITNFGCISGSPAPSQVAFLE